MPHPSRKEHQEQSALFEWAAYMVNQGTYPELTLMYAIPNWRPKESERAYLAAEGVKPNVPDICLPVARKGYHGMYIEMKTPKGRLTKGQAEWLAKLECQGYYAICAKGWEKAKAEIEWYLGGGE